MAALLPDYLTARLEKQWESEPNDEEEEEEEEENEEEEDEEMSKSTPQLSPDAPIARLWRTLHRLGIADACLPLLRTPVLRLIERHVSAQAGQEFEEPKLQGLLDWTNEVVLPTIHLLVCPDYPHRKCDCLIYLLF